MSKERNDMVKNAERPSGGSADKLQVVELSLLQGSEIGMGEDDDFIRGISARTVLPALAHLRSHRKTEERVDKYGEIHEVKVLCRCEICIEVFSSVSQDYEIKQSENELAESERVDGERPDTPPPSNWWDEASEESVRKE